jgi:hypothetical protein
MNFTVFTIIVIIILIILMSGVANALKNDSAEYEVSSTICTYDTNYNYISLENDGTIFKKWTGSFYLKENITKKEYKLGNYAVVFDKNRNSVELFGTFYQVLEGGDVSKITDYNIINNTRESAFYKIEDRKYLIIADNIQNDTGSLSTSNYLLIIIDRLGNALLLNNEINAKTINQMVISTDEFEFDVANETLIYNEETINLKKILGSTNEYVQVAQTNEEDEEKTGDNLQEPTQSNGTVSVTTNNNSSSTTNNSSSTTIIQDNNTNNSNNGNSENNGNSGDSDNNENNQETDTTWVGKLNEWIQDVAAGFQSIYNGSSGQKDTSSLNRSVALNSVSAGTTYIDINYTISDPENKYNVVYIAVSDDTNTYSIALDKSANSYRMTGLSPSTNYTVSIGYKIIFADASTEENIEDTMTTRTSAPTESLAITKVSTSKIYYTLKLDSTFVYDEGAKLVVYINDDRYSAIELSKSDCEKAASTGYSGSLAIPDEYKSASNGTVKIVLEDTKYGGKTIKNNLSAKIVNY